MRTKRFLTTLLLFLSFFSLISAQKELWTPEKLWDLGRVTLYDLSPDGSLVLYGVTYYDVAKNSSSADLYLVKWNGGDIKNPFQLTHLEGNEYNAQFRPDGKKIGFLKDGHLWEINLNGKRAKKISDITMGGFKYSPKGDKILFTQEVKFGEDVVDKYPDLPQTNAKIIDDLMYRHWDHWEDNLYSNVFYIGYKNGKLLGDPVNIQNEPYDCPLQPFGGMENIAWSPDGTKIAYTSKKLSGMAYAVSTNSDIYLYDLNTKETKNMSEGMEGYDMNPVFSPNGRYLTWSSMKEPGFESDRNRIFLYDFYGKRKIETTEGLNYSLTNPQWSADSKKLYFIMGVHGTYHLAYVDYSKKRRVRQLTFGFENYYDFIVKNDHIVARRASMLEPHAIFRISNDTGKANQLTFVNKSILDNTKSAILRKRWVTTSDNKKELVWYIYPPDFDKSKKYPTLLYCQGGPQLAVSQFWSYRWNFQLMAAKGYIIVAPNRRGLPTFGREWNDEISGDWGGQAMQDLLSAIDDAAKEPYVDSTRLGAIGASFGGFSVFWLEGNHQKRFKTFVAHAGMFDITSWYGSTEELFFANKDAGGPYWASPVPKAYTEFSPHLYVNNWDTPILIIHGGRDYRIPDTQAMEAFTAAKLHGLKARFLYYPEESHWVLSPQNSLLWHRIFFDWLEETL